MPQESMQREPSQVLSHMSKPLIPIDLTKSPTDQVIPLHNRWHPDIPPVASVQPGTVFRVECMDWTGGQIGNNDRGNDVRDVDLSQVHYLSGPIAVDGAELGDLLVVDILDIGALPTSPWGFTGIFAKTNGGGFLTDFYPDAKKAIWDFHGIYAVSRHIRGVRFAGLTHPGLIGCAPSAELLAQWNRREAELIASNPSRVPPLANPPLPRGALLGQIRPGSGAFDRVAGEPLCRRKPFGKNVKGLSIFRTRIYAIPCAVRFDDLHQPGFFVGRLPKV